LAVPLDGIEGLWHEYDAYEGNLNKVTAKKMLADRSAAYMTARTVSRELKALLESLDRDEYALDPPTDSLVAARKVAVWQRWIDWEKGNPLGVPERSPLWIQRVQYAYRQALAVLRFYGEVWFEYSRFLVIVGRREEAETIIKTAVEALPVDLIVVFAYADLLETAEGNNGEVKSEERTPNAAGPVYEALIEALDRKIAPTTDEDSIIGESKSDAENVIKENLTLAWIQYMNFARRTDGIAAARAVFTRARKSVNTSHHLFLAAARMEYHCKKDAVVAGKIFELGMARFNRHPEYILAYLQHLLATGDEQNARALFERAMLALGSGGLEVWKVYLDHAFRYGDRASIRLLVQRFQDAFPGHILARDITLFCRLYSYDEAAVGPERLWTFLQGVEPLATPRSTIPRPFFISELIMDLIDKLPSAATYDGPAISPDALVKLLQVVNLIPSEPKPTRITRPSSGITSSKTTNTKRRRARDRLDDGDHRDIPTSAPVRTDDLFAQRRRRE
jgi:cleavage stimulation factor subunit 3